MVTCHLRLQYIFLSTLSLRRATGIQSGAQQATAISIHALLAESDAKIPFAVSELVLISIHALLAESDAFAVWVSVLVGLFLSTLSLRRATGVPGPAGQHSFDFYPRSPCGERP